MSINPFFLSKEFLELKEGRGRGSAARARMKLFSRGSAVRGEGGVSMLSLTPVAGAEHNKAAWMTGGPNVTHAVDEPAKAATREMPKATKLGGILTGTAEQPRNPQDPVADMPGVQAALGAVLRTVRAKKATVDVDSSGKPMLRAATGDPISARRTATKASTDVAAEKASRETAAAKRQAAIDALKASITPKNESIELQERRRKTANAVSVKDIKDAGVVLQDDPEATVSRTDLKGTPHVPAPEPDLPPVSKGPLTPMAQGASSGWQRPNVGGATRPSGSSPATPPAADTGVPSSKKAGSLGHAGRTASYPYGVPPASSAVNFPARPDEARPEHELTGAHLPARTKYGPGRRDLAKDDVGHIGVPTRGGKLRSLSTVTGITRFKGTVPTNVTVTPGGTGSTEIIGPHRPGTATVHTTPDSGKEFETVTIHAKPPKRSGKQQKGTEPRAPKRGIGPDVVKDTVKALKTSGKNPALQGTVARVFGAEPAPTRTVSGPELDALRAQHPDRAAKRPLPSLRSIHADRRNRR